MDQVVDETKLRRCDEQHSTTTKNPRIDITSAHVRPYRAFDQVYNTIRMSILHEDANVCRAAA